VELSLGDISRVREMIRAARMGIGMVLVVVGGCPVCVLYTAVGRYTNVSGYSTYRVYMEIATRLYPAMAVEIES
jgi:hypothetical protein